MTAPIVYDWRDEGLPTMDTATSYAQFRNFRDIVLACLVDGYGDKAAAGWSLVYRDDTTDKERFAISNGNGVLEFIAWGAYAAAVVLHDTVKSWGAGNVYFDTGIDGLFSEADNSVSVQGEYYSTDSSGSLIYLQLYLLRASYFANKDETDNHGWQVFANDKAFYFHILSAPSSTSTSQTVSYTSFFAGALASPLIPRDQPGNLTVLASASDIKTKNISTSGYTSTLYNKMTSLKNPFADYSNPDETYALCTETISSANYRNGYSEYFFLYPNYVAYTGPSNPDSGNLPYLFGKLPGGVKGFDQQYMGLIHSPKAAGNWSKISDAIRIDDKTYYPFNVYINSYGRSNYISMQVEDWV